MNTYATRVNRAYTVLEAAKARPDYNGLLSAARAANPEATEKALLALVGYPTDAEMEALEAAKAIVAEHEGPVVTAAKRRIEELELEIAARDKDDSHRRADVQARKASRTARINRRSAREALAELEAMEELEDAEELTAATGCQCSACRYGEGH